MLKKIFLMLTSIIFFSFGSLAISKENSPNNIAAKSDLEKILTTKKLIVAMPKDDEEVLFYHDKNGELTGFTADMAKDIAKELGVEIEFNREATNYSDLVELLAQNKVDAVICDFSKTLARGKKILYTDTFALFHQTLLINRIWLAQHEKSLLAEKDPIKTINSKDCRIGTMSGTVYEEFAPKLFPSANILKYPTWDELAQALLTGKIDVLFLESFSIRKMLMDKPSLPLKYKALLLKDDPDLIAIGLPKNSEEFWHWLNLYLEIRNIKKTSSEILADYAKKQNS